MAARYLLTVIACFFALHVNALETVNGRIKITVQTTSACSDTVRYIQNQLAPTYEVYKDFLDIEFVPWGRATRDENGTLSCQFGPNDCWANRNHRCALNLLRGNPDAQMHYMLCEFTEPYPSFAQGSYLCAHATGLSLVDIHYCVISPENELDLADEIKGNEMTSALNFIPSIVFNDIIDLAQHTEALQWTKNMVCRTLANDHTTGVTDCEI